VNERAHCPYLGLRQNRAIRFASPTAEHRCYVAGDAQEIPVDQRAYCLSGNHRTCPLYTGEWGATTSGAVGAGGVLALGRRGQRARTGGRDTLFYALVVGLVLTITAVWLGIGYLYALGSAGGNSLAAAASVPAVVIVATPTVAPTVTATGIAAPPAPQGPTAVLGADRVLLDWQPGPPPLTRGYRIQRSDRERGPWFQLNSGLHGFSKYEDSGLQPDTQYFYRITTVDRDGRTSEPTIISVRTLASTPTPTPTIQPTPTFAAPVYIPPVVDPPFVPPTDVPPTPEPTPEPAPEPPTDVPPTAEPVPEPPPPTDVPPVEPTPPPEQPTPEAPTAEPATPEPTPEAPVQPTAEPPTPEAPPPEQPTSEPPPPEPPTPEPPTPEPPASEAPPEQPTAEPPPPEQPTPEPAPQP